MGQTWGKGLLGIIVALTCIFTNQLYALTTPSNNAIVPASDDATVRVADMHDQQGFYYTQITIPGHQTFVIYLEPSQIEQLHAMSTAEAQDFFSVRREIIETFLKQLIPSTLQSKIYDGSQTIMIPNIGISTALGHWSPAVLSGLTKLLSDRIFQLKRQYGSVHEVYLNLAVSIDILPAMTGVIPMAGDREFGINFGYQRDAKEFFFRIVKVVGLDNFGGTVHRMAIRPSIEANHAPREAVFGQSLTMNRVKMDVGNGATFSPATIRDSSGRVVSTSASATWSPYSYDIAIEDGTFLSGQIGEKTIEKSIVGEVHFSFETFKVGAASMTVTKMIDTVKAGVHSQVMESLRVVSSLLSTSWKQTFAARYHAAGCHP